MADVFISYNREDQPRARIIAEALEAEGLSVWWDSNLKAGEAYDEVTEKNLREAGAVVVLWSTRSVNSKWVRAEATIGERSSTLVPAMIEDCDRPLRFELVQAADLINWHGDRSDASWRTFIGAIKAAAGRHETASPSTTAASASSASVDSTIENTFWNSIKDGSERSEFEAYLHRYPTGHFADLAKNRLAAIIEKAETQRMAAQRAAAAPPVQQRQATPALRPQATRPAPAQRPAATAKSSSGSMMPIIAIGAGIVVLGLAAFLMMRGGESKPNRVAQSDAPVTTPTDTPEAVSTPSPNASSTDASLTMDSATPATAAEETLAATDTPISAEENEDTIAAIGEEPVSEPAAEDAEEDAIAEEEVAVQAASSADTYADCALCPTMKVLPSGTFMMGSPKNEVGRYAYEGPQREVTIQSFAIGETEVTFDQWAACVEDSGCRSYAPGDRGFGRGARPVISISWQDAQNYTRWLTNKTGRTYRLPTEAEWEYAARGGTTTRYWWGNTFERASVAIGQTSETGSTPANPFGLFDMLGNAGEWVEDCYVNNFTQAPVDGSAVKSGDCGRRVIRGGHWRSKASDLRSANRSRISASTRDSSVGFRVVADVSGSP